VYLCGGGAGRLSSWALVPLGLGACAVAGLDGAGDEEKSRSMSMGWGEGWSAICDMAEKRFRCSGGRLSGCESSSYLDERRDEYELERRLLVRSRSLTRECDVLSGDEGGVPGLLLLAGVGGARLGTVWLLDFLDDFVKREGRTMEAKSQCDSGLLCNGIWFAAATFS
jgi:hypothetical protein